MVWKLSAAPEHLQRLRDPSQNAEWIVLVPKEIYGADVNEALLAGENANVSRYETADGDVVYIGEGSLQKIHPLIAGGGFSRGRENF